MNDSGVKEASRSSELLLMTYLSAAVVEKESWSSMRSPWWYTGGIQHCRAQLKTDILRIVSICSNQMTADREGEDAKTNYGRDLHWEPSCDSSTVTGGDGVQKAR